MHLQLLNKLAPSPVSSSVSMFSVEMDGKHVSQHVLWPHELFACLYEHYWPTFLEYILGGDKTNPNIFWNGQ